MKTLLARDPVEEEDGPDPIDFVLTMVNEGVCMVAPETVEGKSWLREAHGCDVLIAHYKSIGPLTLAIIGAGMRIANSQSGPH